MFAVAAEDGVDGTGEKVADFLAKIQLSTCSTPIHLTKHWANALTLCGDDNLLEDIIFLSCVFDLPLHTQCLEVLCTFS